MIFDIEKLIEEVKQDPRQAYLDHLGQAICNVSARNPLNTGNAYFYNDNDHTLRIEMIEKLHNAAMDVINTLEK